MLPTATRAVGSLDGPRHRPHDGQDGRHGIHQRWVKPDIADLVKIERQEAASVVPGRRGDGVRLQRKSRLVVVQINRCPLRCAVYTTAAAIATAESTSARIREFIA